MLEGSVLAGLAKSEKCFGDSHHHQAIETVGRDLSRKAWTSDGLVEALEDPRTESLRLRCSGHPELGWNRISFAIDVRPFYQSGSPLLRIAPRHMPPSLKR